MLQNMQEFMSRYLVHMRHELRVTKPTSAAHRTYRASLARGNTLLFQAMRRKEPHTYCRRAVLDVHFVSPSPVFPSGTPGSSPAPEATLERGAPRESPKDWWCIYETDI
jgi:hypothetical protein